MTKAMLFGSSGMHFLPGLESIISAF